MNSGVIPYEIIRLKETTSTNDYAKKLGRQGANHGTVVMAESQSAGKGRLGRKFYSQSGQGVFMSIILKPDIDLLRVSQLTIVAAMAVRNALKKCTGEAYAIKWPNDIVCNGKKLCGILTEMITEQGAIKCVVVGIGINVRNGQFDDELKELATSLKLCTGRDYDIEDVAKAVLESFFAHYQEYMDSKDLKYMKSEYNEALVHNGRKIVVNGNNYVQEGICAGMDETGALLVKTDKGIERIISGEVSVRGVYGYV